MQETQSHQLSWYEAIFCRQSNREGHYPIAFRKVKTPKSFGLSECNRVNMYGHTDVFFCCFFFPFFYHFYPLTEKFGGWSDEPGVHPSSVRPSVCPSVRPSVRNC